MSNLFKIVGFISVPAFVAATGISLVRFHSAGKVVDAYNISRGDGYNPLLMVEQANGARTTFVYSGTDRKPVILGKYLEGLASESEKSDERVSIGRVLQDYDQAHPRIVR